MAANNFGWQHNYLCSVSNISETDQELLHLTTECANCKPVKSHCLEMNQYNCHQSRLSTRYWLYISWHARK